MILDSFKLHTAIIQIQYADAFELWDRAGQISRTLNKTWQGLKLVEGQPQQQVLSAKGVSIQTGIKTSTVTLSGENSLSQIRVQQLNDTYEIWRDLLDLKVLERLSARVLYVKEFENIKEANEKLFSWNLVKWPTSKVFDQPLESDHNGLEINYRFEDKDSFSFLRLKSEQLRFEVDLDPDYVEEHEIRRIKNRLLIDFDRGFLGSINTEKLRFDEWLKGFQHILRRDIDKVIRTE